MVLILTSLLIIYLIGIIVTIKLIKVFEKIDYDKKHQIDEVGYKPYSISDDDIGSMVAMGLFWPILIVLFIGVLVCWMLPVYIVRHI